MSGQSEDCPRRPGPFGRIFLSHDDNHMRVVGRKCRLDLRAGWFAAFVLLVASLLGLVLCLIVRQGIHHYSKQACAAYGEQTERQVKWVDESFVDFDCYVRWNDTWIPRGDYTRITFGHETGAENG